MLLGFMGFLHHDSGAEKLVGHVGRPCALRWFRQSGAKECLIRQELDKEPPG